MSGNMRTVLRDYRLRWLMFVVATGILAVVLLGLSIAVALHTYGQVDRVAAADVIVILGAGMNADGTASDALQRRAQHAAALYDGGVGAALICTGGDTAGLGLTEAGLCARLAAAYDVPPDAIWQEARSLSTEENALFVLEIMQEQGWRSALLVSDNFHLLRAQIVFENYGVPVVGLSLAQVTTGSLPLPEYLWKVRREVVGFYWQAYKVVLRLPVTHPPGVG